MTEKLIGWFALIVFVLVTAMFVTAVRRDELRWKIERDVQKQILEFLFQHEMSTRDLAVVIGTCVTLRPLLDELEMKGLIVSRSENYPTGMTTAHPDYLPRKVWRQHRKIYALTERGQEEQEFIAWTFKHAA